MRQVGTTFTDAATHTGIAQEYTGSPVKTTLLISNLAAGSYHWQARLVSASGSSNWVSYGANTESEQDLAIVISNSAPSTNTST